MVEVTEYKIGQEVRIDNLKPLKGDPGIDPSMRRHIGSTGTIKDHQVVYGFICYRIGSWWYRPEWLAPLRKVSLKPKGVINVTI